MGAHRDAALALLALLAACIGVSVSGATLSSPVLALGGLATVAVELLAARRSALIRRHWERDGVQAAALAFAGALALVFTLLDASSALSALVGSLVTYLAILGALEGRRLVTSGM